MKNPETDFSPGANGSGSTGLVLRSMWAMLLSTVCTLSEIRV